MGIFSKNETIHLYHYRYSPFITSCPIQNGNKFEIKDQKSYLLSNLAAGKSGYLLVRKNKVVYKYNLINVHFHFLSEHTFGGKATGFEMHMVHQKDTAFLTAHGIVDKDTRNTYLVVGTLFDASGKTDNPDFARMNIGTGNVNNLDFSVYSNPGISYYHYNGGLTTPNCNMVVNWCVNQKVVYVSEAQQKALKDWIKGLYPDGNTRKVQPLYNRVIYKVDNTPRTVINVSGAFLKENLLVIVAALIALLF